MKTLVKVALLVCLGVLVMNAWNGRARGGAETIHSQVCPMMTAISDVPDGMPRQRTIEAARQVASAAAPRSVAQQAFLDVAVAALDGERDAADMVERECDAHS